MMNITEKATQKRVEAEAICDIINKLEWLKNDYIETEYDENDNVISTTILDGWHDKGYGQVIVNLINEIEERLLK